MEQQAQGTEEERADCHAPTAKGLPEPKQVESMPKLRVVGNGVSVKSEPWICLPFYSGFEYILFVVTEVEGNHTHVVYGSGKHILYRLFMGAVGAGRSWC